MSLLSAATLLLPTLVLTLAVGTHVSTWGAYKDSPYEGYHPRRQLRTFALAAVGATTSLLLGLADFRALLPALGVVYALERLATEWWKSIVRDDDQSAYTIPMRLGFRGRPVDVAWIRYVVGALVAAGLVGVGLLMHLAQEATGGLPTWLTVLTVGGLGGWATAVGGAWKDAPVEGFSGWKFLRSPAVATAWAVPLSLLTVDWAALCLAAGGMAVASIETYKTFLTGDRAPGKFEGKPVRWREPGVRRALGVAHGGAWSMFALASFAQVALAGSVPAAVAAASVGLGAGVAVLVVLRRNALLAVSPVAGLSAGHPPEQADDRAA
ncbi:MAG: hypothetical protein ACXVWU_11205 [Nocardioides sp.]